MRQGETNMLARGGGREGEGEGEGGREVESGPRRLLLTHDVA